MLALRRFAARAGAVVILALVLAAIFLFDPSATRYFPRCPIFVLTGLKCPGCGTARALHAAVHGNFAEALRFNMALPALLALLSYCVVFPQRAQQTAFVWSIIAFVVVWSIARNVLGI